MMWRDSQEVIVSVKMVYQVTLVFLVKKELLDQEETLVIGDQEE